MRTVPRLPFRCLLNTLGSGLALLVALAAPGLARADVVGDPPPACATGASPEVCHGGPFCKPALCADDSECGGGWTCQDVTACFGTINCQGGEPEPSPVETYEGACTPDNGCDVAGATCQAKKQCLPPIEATTGEPTGGSAGSTGGASATGTGGASATGTGDDTGPTGGASGPVTGDGSSGGDSDGDGGKSSCNCTQTDRASSLPWLVMIAGLVRRRR
ncbi:MAG: hypothetical protein JNL82_17270 [Myxococcales bacterium]|nr:hypothetical protein [Myxococcales bacterium]